MTKHPSSAQPFQLQRDAWGQLILTDAEGRCHPGAVPVRAFPVSDPEHWISICDSAGHEIVAIEDMAELPPQTQRTLQEELGQREFTPVIQRIYSATTEEPSYWRVETDRGPVAFEVSSEEDVRRIEAHQASVLDSHQVRYLIPDLRKMDPASRRILDHFL